MKLNHINLTVTDVQAMVGIFEKYFGLHRTKMNNERMAFMRDENEMCISMFKGDAAYPEMFHIGFTQETVAQVDAIYQRLTADGFTPDAPQDDHGRWTFYFKSPPGMVIEVQMFHQTW